MDWTAGSQERGSWLDVHTYTCMFLISSSMIIICIRASTPCHRQEIVHCHKCVAGGMQWLSTLHSWPSWPPLFSPVIGCHQCCCPCFQRNHRYHQQPRPPEQACYPHAEGHHYESRFPSWIDLYHRPFVVMHRRSPGIIRRAIIAAIP